MDIVNAILAIGSMTGLISFFYVMLKDLFSWLNSPKLKILSLDPQTDQIRLLVKNDGGKVAAINAMGKVTIRKIEKGDILGTTNEIKKMTSSQSKSI
jgi:hypothetical protein